MPRPNQPRTLNSEKNLARRIAYEREKREMTYDGLADRMTRIGCAIQPSGIYKIEKSNPPRRISVDELVGFAQVFGVPVEELLVPLEMVERSALRDLLVEWEAASRAAKEAIEAEKAGLERLKQYVADHPALEPTLQSFVRTWVEMWAPNPDAAEAYWMQAFSDSPEWREKFYAEADRLAEEVTGRKGADRG